MISICSLKKAQPGVPAGCVLSVAGSSIKEVAVDVIETLPSHWQVFDHDDHDHNDDDYRGRSQRRHGQNCLS